MIPHKLFSNVYPHKIMGNPLNFITASEIAITVKQTFVYESTISNSPHAPKHIKKNYRTGRVSKSYS